MSKILITSTQYPYYGGAATNSYALVKYLRFHGHTVACIFFENKDVVVDIDNIGGVFRIGDRDSKQMAVKIIEKYLKGTPDIILSKNYAAPVISGPMFPGVKNVYLVTGSPQMSELSSRNISSVSYTESRMEPLFFAPEASCVKKADLVIPNSHQASKILIKNYGKNKKIKQPIDTSMAFNHKIEIGKKFSDREIDIAFICSNLNRPVKNSKLALKLMSNKSFKSNKKVVIGEGSNIFAGVSNCKKYNLMNQTEVIKIIQNSKLVICTSYYDASPNVIKEAIMAGSNILVSNNCGWSELYPDSSVCSDIYDVDEWVEKSASLIKSESRVEINHDFSSLLRSINGII